MEVADSGILPHRSIDTLLMAPRLPVPCSRTANRRVRFRCLAIEVAFHRWARSPACLSTGSESDRVYHSARVRGIALAPCSVGRTAST